MDKFSKWLNIEVNKALTQGINAGMKGNTKEYEKLSERHKTLSNVEAEYKKILKLNVVL